MCESGYKFTFDEVTVNFTALRRARWRARLPNNAVYEM